MRIRRIRRHLHLELGWWRYCPFAECWTRLAQRLGTKNYCTPILYDRVWIKRVRANKIRIKQYKNANIKKAFDAFDDTKNIFFSCSLLLSLPASTSFSVPLLAEARVDFFPDKFCESVLAGFLAWAGDIFVGFPDCLALGPLGSVFFSEFVVDGSERRRRPARSFSMPFSPTLFLNRESIDFLTWPLLPIDFLGSRGDGAAASDLRLAKALTAVPRDWREDAFWGRSTVLREFSIGLLVSLRVADFVGGTGDGIFDFPAVTALFEDFLSFPAVSEALHAAAFADSSLWSSWVVLIKIWIISIHRLHYILRQCVGPWSEFNSNVRYYFAKGSVASTYQALKKVEKHMCVFYQTTDKQTNIESVRNLQFSTLKGSCTTFQHEDI